MAVPLFDVAENAHSYRCPSELASWGTLNNHLMLCMIWLA
jgi:hypothetical protein